VLDFKYLRGGIPPLLSATKCLHQHWEINERRLDGSAEFLLFLRIGTLRTLLIHPLSLPLPTVLFDAQFGGPIIFATRLGHFAKHLTQELPAFGRGK